VELAADSVGFDVGPETFARSAPGDLSPEDEVNLERPMRLDGFVGGHLVLGHVDGVGIIEAVEREGDTARLRIEWQDAGLAPLMT
jgi:riboflavin synthase